MHFSDVNVCAILSDDGINYLDRDNTKSNKPYYEFSKGDYKDFVIHDKIDWFEVK